MKKQAIRFILIRSNRIWKHIYIKNIAYHAWANTSYSKSIKKSYPNYENF